MHYTNQAFAPSDAIVGRCISSLVSLLWDEEQAQERATKMAAILQRVIVGTPA
jgi:8-amino-3,8-dideoxy-alpha-D-manno-octulosonate transaminase